MGGKRRENYDDWWRCEISFEPALDEIFGVTHSKQGISPTPHLQNIIAADIEAIARDLNRRVRAKFEAVGPRQVSRAVEAASLNDRLLPPVSITPKHPKMRCRGSDSPRNSPGVGFGSFRYAIATEPLAIPAFFVVKQQGDNVQVVVNTNHPFFELVYEKARSYEGPQQAWVECILLAAARASLAAVEPAVWSHLCAEWSDALAVFLGALE
jgi:hypothetical protein